MRGSLVLERRCLPSVGIVWFEQLPTKSKVRSNALDHSVQSFEEKLSVNKLKWMGHILSTPTERLPRAPLCEKGNGWRRDRSVQLESQQKGMKTVTNDWLV